MSKGEIIPFLEIFMLAQTRTNIIILGLLCMIISSVTATDFVFNGGDSCIAEGSKTDLSLHLSEVPQGLSGLNISITVTDPGIASISNITFPDWALLKTMSPLPFDAFGLKMVDLQQKVNPGDTQVMVCGLSVMAHKKGASVITVIPVNVEDDTGGRYALSPVKKTVCVHNSTQGNQSTIVQAADTPISAQTMSSSISPTSIIPSVQYSPSPSSALAQSSTVVPVLPAEVPSAQVTTVKTVPAVKITTSAIPPSTTYAAPLPALTLISCILSMVVVYWLFKKKEAN